MDDMDDVTRGGWAIARVMSRQGDPTRLDTTMLAFDVLKDHGTEKTRVLCTNAQSQGRTELGEPSRQPKQIYCTVWSTGTRRKSFFQPIKHIHKLRQA